MHLFQLTRIYNNEELNFYKHIEIDGKLCDIIETWDSLPISRKLPKTVEFIGERAFEKCSKIEELNLTDNIKQIKKYAFSEMKSLKKINIPKVINFIEEGLFNCCESLTSINLPSNVTSIGQYSFNILAAATISRVGVSPQQAITISGSLFASLLAHSHIPIPWVQ